MLSESASIVAHNLALQRELQVVLRALDAAAVRVVVLKGLPLLRRLGLPLGERRLLDNDILVRRSEVERAYAVLRAMGYREATRRTLAVALRADYQHRLVRRLSSGMPVLLELHWRAFAPRLFDVPEALEWSHVEPLTLDGFAYEVFDRPLTLVHTVAHYVQHGFSEPRILRTFAAAWTAWEPDAGRLATELATRISATSALEYCLYAAASLELTPTSPRLRSPRGLALAALLPPERLLDKGRPNPDYMREALTLLLVAPRKGLTRLRYALLPPLVEAREFVGDDRWAPVLAHYASRPIRVARRWAAYRTALAKNTGP